MSPDLDYKARELVRDAAQLYLSPDFSTPPNISVMMQERGLGREVPDNLKISRYAVAAAGIQLITEEAVIGTGVETRFADDFARMPNERFPLKALHSHIAYNYQWAASKLKRPGASDRYSYLVNRYEDMGLEDPNAPFTTSSVIEDGKMIAHHGSAFVELSASVLAEDSETGVLDSLGRVLVAHQLIPTVTGAASKHINRRSGAPTWMNYDTSNVHLAHRHGTHALAETDAVTEKDRPLFRIPPSVENRMGRFGPLIKCPAHQLLFSTETSLELGLHAVINLAGKRGHYDIEPVEAAA